MESIKIKGKDYIQVNERVAEFRRNPLYAKLSIETEIVEKNYSELTTDTKIKETPVHKTKKEMDSIIIKCVIRNQEGRVISTGTAMEEKTSSFVNETSFVENCETSAVGRALGFLGIGIKDSIASADELVVAIKNQTKKAPVKKKVEHINQI